MTVILRDYRHASKLFVDDNMRLHPKQGFLFHVFIDINPEAAALDSKNPNRDIELGMLVKNVSLPKFTVDTQTMNAYNRKIVIQKRITYESLSINFHDDSADVIRNFWFDYFNYYYRDSDHQEENYISPHLYQPTRMTDKWGFTPRTSSAPPYLKSIRIYSLHGGQFSEYVLVNPIVKNFRHGEHNHTPGEILSNEMIVEFETVLYYQGKITFDNVKGFAILHYDLEDPNTLGNQGPNVDTSERLLPTPSEFVDSLQRNIFSNPPPSPNLPTSSSSNTNSPVAVPIPEQDPNQQYTGYESAFVPTPPSGVSYPVGNGISQRDQQRGRIDVANERNLANANRVSAFNGSSTTGTLTIGANGQNWSPGQRLSDNQVNEIRQLIQNGNKPSDFIQSDSWRKAYDQYYLQTAESKLGVQDNAYTGYESAFVPTNPAQGINYSDGGMKPQPSLRERIFGNRNQGTPRTEAPPTQNSNLVFSASPTELNSLKRKLQMSQDTAKFLQNQYDLRQAQGQTITTGLMKELRTKILLQKQIAEKIQQTLNSLQKI